MSLKVRVTKQDICQGIPEEPESCPIALAVRREVKPDWLVSVTHAHIWVDSVPYGEEGGVHLKYVIPSNAYDFIVNFDDHKEVKPFEFDVEPS